MLEAVGQSPSPFFGNAVDLDYKDCIINISNDVQRCFTYRGISKYNYRGS